MSLVLQSEAQLHWFAEQHPRQRTASLPAANFDKREGEKSGKASPPPDCPAAGASPRRFFFTEREKARLCWYRLSEFSLLELNLVLRSSSHWVECLVTEQPVDVVRIPWAIVERHQLHGRGSEAEFSGVHVRPEVPPIVDVHWNSQLAHFTIYPSSTLKLCPFGCSMEMEQRSPACFTRCRTVGSAADDTSSMAEEAIPDADSSEGPTADVLWGLGPAQAGFKSSKRQKSWRNKRGWGPVAHA
nr:hypothetical protein Iba_chr13cCG12080 [Ipomoea batatas]